MFKTVSVLSAIILLSSVHSAVMDPDQRVIAGYWHNFSNGSADIPLDQIPGQYNVINISFIENIPGSTFEVDFTPYSSLYPDEQVFIGHVAALKAQGRRVQISIGGQNGHVVLGSESEKNTFVTQTIAIIEKYGFNGLDIDLEGASIGSINSSDFADPGSPQIAFFITAVEEILDHFGPDFWLTAAPEIFYVQDATAAYGSGVVGAYLPFLYHFHTRINVLHVQLYNSSNAWAQQNGNTLQLAQNSADFMVYQCDLLLTGFATANGAGPSFPAFRPNQIAIGKPATSQAAGSGYASPETVVQALHYLATGEGFGGQYILSNPAGYGAFRGVMTWSVNWDQTAGYAFANATYDELSSYGAVSLAGPAQRIQTGILTESIFFSGISGVRDIRGRSMPSLFRKTRAEAQ